MEPDRFDDVAYTVTEEPQPLSERSRLRRRVATVLPARARAAIAPARLAVWPLESAVVAKIRERIDARGTDEVDVRALAAVAAVRPPERHELLAAKAHGATPAVAGLDSNDCFVDESHGLNERTGE